MEPVRWWTSHKIITFAFAGRGRPEYGEKRLDTTPEQLFYDEIFICHKAVRRGYWSAMKLTLAPRVVLAFLCLLSFAIVAPVAEASANGVVISQIYGGGGNSG